MKTTYINPRTRITRIETTRHLAASPDIIGGIGEGVTAMDSGGGNLDIFEEIEEQGW